MGDSTREKLEARKRLRNVPLRVYYTPEEVAVLLKVKPSTVRQWLRRKLLRGTRLARGLWRVSQQAIDEFTKPEGD